MFREQRQPGVILSLSDQRLQMNELSWWIRPRFSFSWVVCSEVSLVPWHTWVWGFYGHAAKVCSVVVLRIKMQERAIFILLVSHFCGLTSRVLCVCAVEMADLQWPPPLSRQHIARLHCERWPLSLHKHTTSLASCAACYWSQGVWLPSRSIFQSA